jgi:hypothetical protein
LTDEFDDRLAESCAEQASHKPGIAPALGLRASASNQEDDPYAHRTID